MTRRSDILSRPSPSSWDEARAVAEVALLLLGLCLATGVWTLKCSDPCAGVLGFLVVWTASLILFGELVLRADRRVRYRSAVLAEERSRIMRSVFDEPSPSD